MATKIKDVWEFHMFVFRKWIDKENDHVKEWLCVREGDDIFLNIVGEWKECCGHGRTFVRYEKEIISKNGFKRRKRKKIKLPDEMLVGMMGEEHVYYSSDWKLDDRWSPLNIELKKYNCP